MGFIEDTQNLTIEEKFHKWLPNTLYLSHYELSKSYGNTPEEWRKFLRDNHLFIESELAAITEAEARSALSRLGNAGGQEVTALKALLDKSKLINDAQRQNVKVVMHFLPSNEGDLHHEPISDTRLSSDRPTGNRPDPTSHPSLQEKVKQQPPMSDLLSSILNEKPTPATPEPPKRISKYR